MYLKYWKGRVFRKLVENQFVESIQFHHVSEGTILTITERFKHTFDIKLKDFEALYITDPSELIEVLNRQVALEQTLHAACLVKYNGVAFIAYMHRDAREFPERIPYRLVEWNDVLDIVKRNTDSPEWRAAFPNVEAAQAREFRAAWEALLDPTNRFASGDDDEEPEKRRHPRRRKQKPQPAGPALPCRKILLKDREDGDAGTS